MKKKRKLSPITFFNAKVTATISITFVLFVLGLVIFISLFANNLSGIIKEQLTFDIILKDNLDTKQIQDFQKRIESTPFSKSTTYISKDDALKNLEEELGENPNDFLDVNPLPDIIQVHLNSDYVHPDSIKIIEHYFSSYPNDIKKVEHKQELIEKVSENSTKIGFILLIIAIPLLFISFVLINNTIRLMVYSKRFLIYTMQLVGAKKSFIRRPFIMSNIWSGLTAAVIACGLLYWLIYYIAGNFPDQYLILNRHFLIIVFGSVFVLGIFTSALAAYFAVNKYVGADIDDLHRM